MEVGFISMAPASATPSASAVISQGLPFFIPEFSLCLAVWANFFLANYQTISFLLTIRAAHFHNVLKDYSNTLLPFFPK